MTAITGDPTMKCLPSSVVNKPTDSVVSDLEDTTETTTLDGSSLFDAEVELSPVDETTPTSTAATPPIPQTIIPKLDYASIPSFDQFTDLTNDDHYIKIPRDWQVLVADIEGSTKAIEAGRYRDVNTIGVSCIAAVRNAIVGLNKKQQKFNQDFPYVFGGDGASLVVPPHHFDAACDALRALQTLAQTNYQMHLRIGSTSVGLLEDQGNVVVEVAKYEIASGMCIALFRGGGLALADTWIKAGQGRIESVEEYCLDEEENEVGGEEEGEDADSEEEEEAVDEEEASINRRRTPEANLEGLSCRWNKIPSKHGCVLSLLVMHNEDVYSNEFLSRRAMEALTDDEDSAAPFVDKDKKPSSSQIYNQVLVKLGEILAPQNSLAKANPVNLEAATYKSAGEMIEDENRLHADRKRSLSFWTGRAVEIGLCHLIFRMKKLQTAIIDAPAYTQAMRTHSDHLKFDDMIRGVIDCTLEQADEIESYLNGLHREGRQIFFGLQRSQNTLMTCLLEDTNAGNHVHFVDGDLGGYAVAAKDLKLQLGNYALAKRGMSIRLNLTKQHSQNRKMKKKRSRRKLRRNITE